MDVLLQFLGAAVMAVLIGGFAPLIGVAVGWNALAVFLGATSGSIAFMWLVIFGAAPIRARIQKRFGNTDAKGESRVRYFYERYGEVGLATLVPLVLGPVVALTAAVIFGVDKARFAGWYAASTAIGFAVLTVLWVVVL